MADLPNIDEQKLEEFKTGLNSMKPEGFTDENWGKFTESVISFHEDEVKSLKINSAKMKQEKQDMATKIANLEASATKSAAEMKTLSEQLAANQPEELKKLYENQQKALQDVFSKKESDLSATIEKQKEYISQLEKGVLERDVVAEFNKAASEKNWLGGAKEYAQALVVGQHGELFSRLNMDGGKTVLVNKDSQDISQALDKFLSTEFGKSLLKSGTSGGGADGSTSVTHPGSITKAQYEAMSPEQQMQAVLDGTYLG